MIKVRVIKIPEGEAPEEVRKEWIGCILPAKMRVAGGFVDDGLCPLSPAVADSKGQVKNVSGVLIDTDEAIRILERKPGSRSMV